MGRAVPTKQGRAVPAAQRRRPWDPLRQLLGRVSRGWGGGRSKALLRAARIRVKPRRRAGDAGDDGLRAVMRALSHPDDNVRLGALRLLSEFSGEHAASLIARAVFDLNPTVRRIAVRAAGRVGQLSLAPALIVALGDDDQGVRHAAADALRKIVAGEVAVPDGDRPISAEETGSLKRWWQQARVDELTSVDP